MLDEMAFLSTLLRKVRVSGFVGPRFAGFRGKLRLLYQDLVIRTDVVLTATPESSSQTFREVDLSVNLQLYKSYAEFEPHASDLDVAYYRGYAAAWKQIFNWGEILALALKNGQVVGFGWIQQGSPEGRIFHYGHLFRGEYRILRVGVLPNYRRRGINSAFYSLLLRHLFDMGASRVYIDCNKDNIPSLKAQIRAGFRPIGEIRVLGPLLGRDFIRWQKCMTSAQE